MDMDCSAITVSCKLDVPTKVKIGEQIVCLTVVSADCNTTELKIETRQKISLVMEGEKPNDL